MIFTKRELDVLRLLAKGRTPSEIAQQLHIAESTVDTYCKRISMELTGTGISTGDLKRLSPEVLDELVKGSDPSP